MGCPVLCDRLYGGRSRLTSRDLGLEGEDTVLLDRHALHARRLQFAHPTTLESMEITAPVPDDLQATLVALRSHRSLA
jgi:23S rRNA pseudouridine1911/1915/1917 synthase